MPVITGLYRQAVNVQARWVFATMMELLLLHCSNAQNSATISNTDSGGGAQSVNLNQSNGGGGGMMEVIIALGGTVAAIAACGGAYFKMKGGGNRVSQAEP